MIGMSYLLFFTLYIALWRAAVRNVRAWAKQSGRSPRRWAWVAHIGMYSLVFWDFLPTVGLHQYYCATEAGFTQYKTLAQWEADNPGVADTLTPIKKPEWQTRGNLTRVPLNQRFAWDTRTVRHPFHVRERDEQIVDVKTGDVLARYVDFDTDILGVERGSAARGVYDYKGWLNIGSCEIGQKIEKTEFNELYHLVKYQEEIHL